MLFGFGIQNEDSENDGPDLKAAGCDRIVLTESTQLIQLKLEELIEYLRPGDTLAVVDFDRLGTNMASILRAICKCDEAGVALRVEKRDIIPGTQTGDMFQKICGILSAFLISERSKLTVTLPDAKTIARRRGRPAVLTIADRMKAKKMLIDQNVSVPVVARLLKVSPATIYRHFPETARSRFRTRGAGRL